jgi:hypothetical protein
MNLTRRALLAAGVAAAVLPAQDADDRMGAARDLLYQALELLSGKSTTAQIERAIGYLKRSLDQYPGFGDAHYYRHLCLKRINQEPAIQSRALEAAMSYHSEALQEKRDPFTLAVPKIYQDLATVGQKWALVVGISRFQPDKGADPLNCAAQDATSFAELLCNPEIGRFPAKQVFCLTDDKATTAAIKARLNTIATKAKSEDIVVVYISTHGSSRSEDIKQVSYLLTYDTDTTSKDDIFGSALPMVEISGIVSTRCTAQRTVLIFDTCHSGESTASQTLSGEDADRLREGAGRYILSSCRADERSYEDATHGYFTASLIHSLSERKGCVRIGDLFQEVQREVSVRVSKETGKSQRPIMFHSEDAAPFILGAAPGGANEQCVIRT